jgi:predicted transcriptional regulator
MEIDQAAARRGLLKFIDKKGGSVPIALLHGHSKLMYRAAHQDFSHLMEGLVGDGLVTYSDDTFHITEKGREQLASES